MGFLFGFGGVLEVARETPCGIGLAARRSNKKKLLRRKGQGYRGTRSSPRDRLPTIRTTRSQPNGDMGGREAAPGSWRPPGKKEAGPNGRDSGETCRRPSPPTCYARVPWTLFISLPPPQASPYPSRPERLPLLQPSRRVPSSPPPPPPPLLRRAVSIAALRSFGPLALCRAHNPLCDSSIPPPPCPV